MLCIVKSTPKCTAESRNKRYCDRFQMCSLLRPHLYGYHGYRSLFVNQVHEMLY